MKTTNSFFIIFTTIALFLISGMESVKAQLPEKQKIERLILSVEKLEGAQFYRNGTWHTAQEAAEHLRLKWSNAGSRIKTARQFIDKLASSSSITGKPYKMKFKDGNVMDTRDFLNQQLEKLK